MSSFRSFAHHARTPKIVYCNVERCLTKIKRVAQYVIVSICWLKHTCLTLFDARTCTGFFVPARLFVYVAWFLTSPGSSAFLNIFQTKTEPILSNYKESSGFFLEASDIEENTSSPSDFFAVIEGHIDHLVVAQNLTSTRKLN